jgi:serpin B
MNRLVTPASAFLALLVAVTSVTAQYDGPNTGPVDVSQVVHGNNRFGVDLFDHLAQQNAENLLVSPFSISTAFAMAYAGARGQTASQMVDVFHFGLPSSDLHSAYGGLLSSLRDASRDGYTLRAANRLWGQQGFGVLPEFLDITGQQYGAPYSELDFIGQSDASRQLINQWVASQTENKIQDLFPSGAINRDTRLVLANAIYLDANWQQPFDAAHTRSGTFTVSSDEQVTVSMMHQTSRFGYAGLPALEILEMPYAGDALSMLIVLPRQADGLDDVYQWLRHADLSLAIDELEPTTVAVSLPKFRAMSELQLNETLAAMGMTAPFSQEADFSGITGERDLYIQSAIHKSFIDVNEWGTEAAAATGISIGRTSIEIPEAVFRADHPFVFLIRDNITQSTLFMGRVTTPEAPTDDIFPDHSAAPLMPGDADRDLDFDQLDLIQVQSAAKYLTGKAATWGEGDWNGAPGGKASNPPAGDGLFDQGDIIAALSAAVYQTGPYGALVPRGQSNDGQTSVGYNATTGEVFVDAPAGVELTSININSASGIFSGEPAQNLGGSFDNDADNNIFKATFGSSFGSLSFGNVAQAGLAEDFLLGDLTVVGSLEGGGALGDVDMIYVPEPATVVLLVFGAFALLARRQFGADAPGIQSRRASE